MRILLVFVWHWWWEVMKSWNTHRLPASFRIHPGPLQTQHSYHRFYICTHNPIWISTCIPVIIHCNPITQHLFPSLSTVRKQQQQKSWGKMHYGSYHCRTHWPHELIQQRLCLILYNLYQELLKNRTFQFTSRCLQEQSVMVKGAVCNS